MVKYNIFVKIYACFVLTIIITGMSMASIDMLSHILILQRPLSDTPLNLFIRMSLVLIISGLICYLFARDMTSPILKLGTAVRQFAEGNLSIRVSPWLGGRRDEISRLAQDFDNMAEQIEALVISQRNLMRDVSHELRSPLARMNVALELCRMGKGPELEKYLDRISNEAERLNMMIDQILTYNKLESASGPKMEKLDLGLLIREIVSDADYEAKSRKRSVVANPETCIIEADREMLRRAIENVVRNAVIYTAEGTSVEVYLNRENSNVLISVRDHGDGVPEEALTQLFNPFYRVDLGRSRETGGVGLGLAISEAAIRLHNGSIKAENCPEGGLVIEMMLPGVVEIASPHESPAGP